MVYYTSNMRANIHPTWYKDAKVICACGNSFTTGSSLPEIRVEICSLCHPYFTNQQKLVDTLGQVERFGVRIQKAQVKKEQIKRVEEIRASKKVEEKKEKPTLKDLLMQARKQAVS